MGTNYYWEEKPPCKTCERPYEDRHIGKSSGGWCFALHVYPDEGINTLEDWKELWSNGAIQDEYGDKVSKAEMLKVITNRSWCNRGTGITKEFLEDNHAILGPNYLLRSKIDGRYCISYGLGTWDNLIGDFS